MLRETDRTFPNAFEDLFEQINHRPAARLVEREVVPQAPSVLGPEARHPFSKSKLFLLLYHGRSITNFHCYTPP